MSNILMLVISFQQAQPMVAEKKDEVFSVPASERGSARMIY